MSNPQGGDHFARQGVIPLDTHTRSQADWELGLKSLLQARLVKNYYCSSSTLLLRLEGTCNRVTLSPRKSSLKSNPGQQEIFPSCSSQPCPTILSSLLPAHPLTDLWPTSMDFASLMSSAISAKSPPPSTTPTKTPSQPSNKYLKRSTLESERQAAYLAEQSALAAAREEKLVQKRKHEEEEAERTAARNEKRQRLAEESRLRREEEEEKKERARRKRLGLPDLSPKGGPGDQSAVIAEEEEDIPSETLIAKFREMGEPTILFGETYTQRLSRYRTLTAPPKAQIKLSSGPIPTSLELLPESELKVPSSLPKDKAGRDFLFRQLSSYFSLVLSEWIAALASRQQSVKESSQGRAAENAMLQSRENMRPLFKKFETGDLEDALLQPIVEIVHAAQERRYVDANDGYLRLSIGKAAWPIGVTMVGIHERSAREKLHESDSGKAHIMSDEVTRKFLQSIKRCLSFAQTRWPPEDIGQLMG